MKTLSNSNSNNQNPEIIPPEHVRSLHHSDHVVSNGEVERLLVYTGKEEFNIRFRAIVFKKNVFFEKFENNHIVEFIDCVFEDFVLINESQLREAKFKNCRFENGLKVQESKIEWLRLVDCHLEERIDFDNVELIELIFDDITSNKTVIHCSRISTKVCTLTKIRDNIDVVFTGHNIESGKYKICVIEELNIYANAQFKGLLLFSGLNIGSLSLEEDNTSGRIVLKDLKVNLIKIWHFTNTGTLSFSNIEPRAGTILHCSNSNLGKCEIYDVDFGLFDKVIIQSSNIQDIIPTNVTWCKDITTYFFTPTEYKEIREVYRQLKNVMIRQNDKVQELVYHKLEMNALLRQLKQQGANWPDRFILWSNKVSNAHGHSWRRAIVMLLGITLVAYVSIKLLLGYTQFDSSTIIKHVGLFLESMNPIRKFSAVYDETKKGPAADLAYTIDVLYRIVTSYLIFQFISAFRKYVKK